MNKSSHNQIKIVSNIESIYNYEWELVRFEGGGLKSNLRTNQQSPCPFPHSQIWSAAWIQQTAASKLQTPTLLLSRLIIFHSKIFSFSFFQFLPPVFSFFIFHFSIHSHSFSSPSQFQFKFPQNQKKLSFLNQNQIFNNPNPSPQNLILRSQPKPKTILTWISPKTSPTYLPTND